MEFDKVLKLIEAVSASALTGFTLEENGTRLVLEKKPVSAGAVPAAAASAAPAGSQVFPAVPPGSPAVSAAPTTPAVPADSAAPSGNVPDSGGGSIPGEEIVKAPLVGTFYAAPSEEAEPFVREGDTVKKGQVLGIIEAMKLMNEIESEYDGEVEAVLISNEQVVEYGQPLFRIRRKG